jgi:hypothetical protein
MQSDDVIWSVINTQFCSYKVKFVLVHILEVEEGQARLRLSIQNYNSKFLSE